MQAGATGPARVIYGLYGGLCHQLGYRSWYLFGERAAYPRDIFESDFDRQFYRVTLVGDVPIGVDGRRSTALEGEPIVAV